MRKHKAMFVMQSGAKLVVRAKEVTVTKNGLGNLETIVHVGADPRIGYIDIDRVEAVIFL